MLSRTNQGSFMTWNVGQQVVCDGVDWGLCQIRMSNDNMVVIYCPRHELVMSGNPVRLHEAGWRSAIGEDYLHSNSANHPTDDMALSGAGQTEANNVICLERWKNGGSPQEAVFAPHR